MTAPLPLHRRDTCNQPTPGGPCRLRTGHRGTCLPDPKRRARSANDEKEQP
jgi:hypothetical protein